MPRVIHTTIAALLLSLALWWFLGGTDLEADEIGVITGFSLLCVVGVRHAIRWLRHRKAMAKAQTDQEK